ncbi:hypothetical protein BGX27_003132 [Mortierella sp. AM989]|nr:hypothetical protein BGX27_003132 [Mortierella sp. AM989]
MFTSHGYQPSIFMDSCPKHIRSTERRDRPRDERVDYIQIRLDSIPPSPLPDTPPPPISFSEPNPTLVSNAPLDSLVIDDSFNVEISSDDDDPMEWESCLSSPQAQTVPDLDHRSVSPFLGSEQITSPDFPPVQVIESAAPIAFAFQKHTMLPHLPFGGRCQSIFLAPETSSDGRMHRRVKDLLHNTSVQRIRTWLKSTIEYSALEQWRNVSLLSHLTNASAVPKETNLDSCDNLISSDNDDCPICFKFGTAMKVVATCGHMICWKCEQDLDRAGNIACPMCRRMRLATTYKNVGDMFRTTIGLHPSDYIHKYCIPAQEGSLIGTSSTLAGSNEHCDDDDEVEIERELADRYLWEQSASFLEHLQAIKICPSKQYFQLNAAQDLCFKPSTERFLPEYNDQSILEPPTSGLVLPAHRLYIALIHFCIDMLTLPKLSEFQLQPQFKREVMLLELVTLFLVPTDEFSPRGPTRIYNVPAWVEHGQHILARIYRFIQSKACQNLRELVVGEPLESVPATRVANIAVPSTLIPRHILYLGTARWTWIAQSLTVLLTWLQAAQSNPSMVPPVANWPGPSPLGKRSLLSEENPRPIKRRRISKRAVVHTS